MTVWADVYATDFTTGDLAVNWSNLVATSFTTANVFDVASVNSGLPIAAGQTGVPFTGSMLGANTAARTVSLVQDTVTVTQTQVTGNDTGGTFNVVGFGAAGKLAYGPAVFKVTSP